MDQFLSLIWTVMIVVTCLGAGAIGLIAGVWLYLRFSPPTDPQQLAMSDPWIRAHLDKLPAGTPGEAPPAEAPAPPEEKS